MSFEFDEKVEEPKDWTKLVWMGVAALFAVMIVAMFFLSESKPPQSLVTARHILIACDQSDIADKTRALELIKDLRARIENGESFAKLAEEYSDDPGTKNAGGMLPPSPRGTFADSFEEYVWTAPVGQLSDVVVTMHGFHLIVVEDRFIHEADLYDKELEQRAKELLRQQADGGSPAASDNTTAPEDSAADSAPADAAPESPAP